MFESLKVCAYASLQKSDVFYVLQSIGHVKIQEFNIK